MAPFTLDYSRVVQLIAGNKRATWLNEFFVAFMPTLWTDIALEHREPTRKKLANRLESVSRAASVLRGEIDGPHLSSALMTEDLERFGIPVFQRNLALLAAKAEAAKLELFGFNGKLRAGRGRALAGQSLAPRVLCAVVIAEAWRHVHGRYPAPRARAAQEAADLCWTFAGGKQRLHLSNPIETWRPYLGKAVADPAPTLLHKFRSSVRRYLAETERSCVMLARA